MDERNIPITAAMRASARETDKIAVRPTTQEDSMRWHKVGREYHSADGRYQVYCSGVTRNYFGSAATWVATTDDRTWRTTRASRAEAQAACTGHMTTTTNQEGRMKDTKEDICMCDAPFDHCTHGLAKPASYYIVDRMSGKTLAGPFSRYVDAFNVRATIGPIGTVVER